MGSVNLDNTGSGADVTLSSDGTDLLLDGTAIGGGGGSPDLFADNWNGTSTQPSATGENAVALGYGSVSSGWMGMALGTRAQAYGSGQTTWGMVAFTDSYASGRHSLAGAIASNASRYGATGQHSVALGQQSKATSSYATAIGMTCTASGSYSTAIGDNAVASHTNGIAIGDSATTSATNQIALGGTADTVKISGAFTLPTSDGTNGQVLTTNGSGAVTFADAGGGGSPDYYAADTTGYTTNPTASGNGTIAVGYNAVASAELASAFGPNTDATGQGATALGYLAQATNSRSVAIARSYAGGIDSFAANISNNTSSYGATGNYSIAMGYLNRASGYESMAVGGDQNVAASARGFIGGGQSNTVSANNGAIIGGDNNSVNSGSNYSTIIGGERNETNQQYTVASGLRAKTSVGGQWAHSAGHFAATGDAQSSKYVLRSDTTDATAEALTSTNTSGSIVNQVILSNNSAYSFSGTIVARQKASEGTACAAWKVEGLIRREGSAGTTVLVNSATTVLDNTPSWGMALSADTTNGGLAITATGAASTNIRLVATIHTSEVTYA